MSISKIAVKCKHKNDKFELLINKFEEQIKENIGKYEYEKVTLNVKKEYTTNILPTNFWIFKKHGGSA